MACVAMVASAQTDITRYVLVNAGFDESSSWVTANVDTQGDPNSHEVVGWTGSGAAWSASAAMGYGSETQLNGVTVPAADPAGNNDGGALGVSCGWGGKISYSQTLIQALPAGTYTIAYKAINLGTASQLKAEISFAGQTKEATASFASAWTEYKAEFTITENPAANLEISFTAVSGGSGSNAKIFVDGVKISAANGTDVSGIVSTVAQEYAEVLALWQSVNTTNYRWDAEFEDQVVTSDILNKMNEADKLLVKVAETNFDEASDSQNQTDLAAARNLIEAVQQTATENYQVLKANKDANEAINAEIQNLRDELAAAEAKVATDYPNANVTDALQAINDKIDALQTDADQAFANKTAVDFKDNTLPTKAEEIRNDIANLLQDAQNQQDRYNAEQAQIAADAAIAESFLAGDYIIYNVEAQAYLGGANSWGTQASIIPNSRIFTLETTGANAIYKLNSHQYNSETAHYLGSNLFVDNDGVVWKIAKGTADGQYTLTYDGKYLAAGEGGIAVTVADATAAAAQWQIVSYADAVAALAEGSDATFVIKNANFSRNAYRLETPEFAWTVSEDCTNKNLAGGADDNMCAESWRSTFTISQTIEGIPNGYYTLNAQAALTDYAELYDGANYPVVFANDRSSAFNNMEGTDRGSNMATLSASFSAGKYYVKPVEVYVTDGTLTVGVKGTRTDTWAIWDNFTLTYNGDDATAYNEFVAASLQADLDAAKQKFEDAKTEIDQLDAFVATATEEDVNAIQGKIDAAQDKIDNAAAESEIIEAIAQINADIDALVEKANNLQTTNKAAYDELIAAYNELKDQWQATYDRINAKYAGMVDNEQYTIKIYNGETLTPEEIETTGAYEKDGEWYVNAFITRDDFNKMLTDLNKVDYQRNLDGYDEATDAIERSNAKGACEANKEYILAEIQKDSEAIEAVWNKARIDHDANILNANNTNLKQLQKAYDANVAAYKDAINKVNDHIAAVHDAEIAKKANSDLFDIYKAQEAAMKAATDAYAAVEAKNDELKQNDTFPTEIFSYEEYATTLDENVNAKCQEILDDAETFAVIENAALYDEYEEKANALLGLITTAQATVYTYSSDVKTAYTAQLDAKKAEVNAFIADTLKPYDNDEDDPCIKADTLALNTAIADFTDQIAAIADAAKAAQEAYLANEAAYAKVIADINNVLAKLTADKAVVDSYDPTVGVATYGELLEALLELSSEAEFSKEKSLAVADSTAQLAQLKELNAAVDEYFNNALLDIINAKADAAAAYLAEVKAAIEGYTFPGKEAYIEEADKIAQEIADIKEAAAADFDAVELIDTYKTYIEQIGEKVGEAKGLRRAAANAAGSDDFATLTPSSYYLSGTTEAGWSYENAQVLKTDAFALGEEVFAVCINGKTTASGSITSPLISGGVATVYLNYGYTFTESNGVDFTVSLVNETGETVASKSVVNAELEKNEPAYAALDFNVTDDVRIVITNNSPSQSTSNKDRYSIWDISWTAPTTPEEPVVDPTPADPTDDRTIYEKIDDLKTTAAEAQAKYEAELANQAAYDETTAKIAELQQKLDDAEDVLAGYKAEYTTDVEAIQAKIDALTQQAKDAFDAATAVADSAAILAQIPAIETEIDNLLEAAAIAQSDYYKEQLADQVDALKETWNKAYAATSDAAELARLDAIYNDIQGIAAEIASDETILDAEDFAEDKAALDALDKAILKATDLEKYLAENVTRGDLTGGNNGLDINDVTTLIDIIISDTDLSGYDNAEMFYAADVNGDGVINILDITTLINKILDAPVEEGNGAKTRMVNNDYLVADGTELSLINTNAYTTFQMDITVADGATLNDIMLADRASDFQVAFGQISANTYRVVVVSLSNATIAGNEGLLINLDITGDQTAEFSNVLFSDVRAQGYALPIISDATAITAIKANVDADCQIFTMGGAQVNGLQKGINIVKYADGSTKKLFVK